MSELVSVTKNLRLLACLVLLAGSLAGCLPREPAGEVPKQTGSLSAAQALLVTASTLPSPEPSEPHPSELPTLRTTKAVDQSPTYLADSTETRLATAIETPWHYISSAVVECKPAGVYANCQDELLGMSFEMPASWGTITGVLRQGETGLRYDYSFSTQSEGTLFTISAGGRSKDFSEGRGAMITDFSGYEDGLAGARCPQAAEHPRVCLEIQENVLLLMDFPLAEYACNPAPGSFSEPYAVIEVALPDEGKINGFRFAAPFLSKAMLEELTNAKRRYLGWMQGGQASECEDDRQVGYDTWVDAFAQRVERREVDKVTAQNIQRLEHLGRSVELGD